MKATRVNPELLSKIAELLEDAVNAGDTGRQGDLDHVRGLLHPGKARKSPKRKGRPERDHEPNREHTLWIPGWHPSSANEREGQDWRVRDSKKKKDAKVVTRSALAHSTKLADRPRRVWVTLRYPNKRSWHDQDNVGKSLYDALRDCGLIWDDGPEWCDQQRIHQEIGDKGTLIVMQDFD